MTRFLKSLIIFSCLTVAVAPFSRRLDANTLSEKESLQQIFEAYRQQETLNGLQQWFRNDDNRELTIKIAIATGVTVGVLVVGHRVVAEVLARFMLPQSNTKLAKRQLANHRRIMQITKRMMELNPKFDGFEFVESTMTLNGKLTNVLIISPPKHKIKNRGRIFAHPGRNSFYQNRVDEYLAIVEKTGMPMIVANYPLNIRSVEQLEKWSISFALEALKGYDPSKSVGMGQSLGGQVATSSVHRLRTQYNMPVSLLTDRSFSSLSKAGAQKTPFSEPVARWILKTWNWEMEPWKFIDQIPQENQAHFSSPHDDTIKWIAGTPEYKKKSIFNIFSIHHVNESPEVIHHTEKAQHFVVYDENGHATKDLISKFNEVIKKMIGEPER